MGEVTIVFVDTSVLCKDSLCWFHDQFDAVEIYCEAKLKAHPDNLVSVLSSGHQEASVLGATTSLENVRLALGDLKARNANYTTNLLRGFKYSRDHVWEEDMKRRMVVFTGGPLYFPREQLPQAIQFLKEERVVLDVVDFGKRLYGDDDDEYKMKLILLKELVNAVNDNNSNENEDSRYFLIEDYGFSLSHHISTSSILPSLSEKQARIKRIRHCNVSSSICSNHDTVADEVVDVGDEVVDYGLGEEVFDDSGWGRGLGYAGDDQSNPEICGWD